MGQPDIVEMAKPYLDIVAFSLVPLIFFRRTNSLLMGNQILNILCGPLSLGMSLMSSSIIS
jgi:Na+-driven multidrug efflux pump